MNYPWLKPYLIYFTVFITGCCILAIELVASRLLAPFFGSSIYTWSAIISVTLAALALGYKLGGQYSDRYPLYSIPYIYCLAAGLWTLMTPFFAGLLIPALILFDDIRLAVILASSILFFINLFLLSAINPAFIRLLNRSSDQAGSTSGLIFSISTAGSLLGALITGFVIIPAFGTRSIFIAIGIVLVLLSMAGFLILRKFKLVAISFILYSSLFVYQLPSSTNTDESLNILDEQISQYSQVKVVVKDNIKMLLVDGIGQNYVSTDSQFTTPYISFISSLPALFNFTQNNKQALFIGLGAGQLPVNFHTLGFSVDTVELDPIIPVLAQKHFDFNLPSSRVNIADGRVYLQNTVNTFDFIIIDAFSSDNLPWHLLTQETFMAAKQKLSSHGFLVINFTATSHGQDTASVLKTLQNNFKHAYAYSYSPDQPGKLTSIIFIASSTPQVFPSSINNIKHNIRHDVEQFIIGKTSYVANGIVLTDDYNPVSQFHLPSQLLWRKEMYQYLGEGNLTWLFD